MIRSIQYTDKGKQIKLEVGEAIDAKHPDTLVAKITRDLNNSYRVNLSTGGAFYLHDITHVNDVKL